MRQLTGVAVRWLFNESRFWMFLDFSKTCDCESHTRLQLRDNDGEHGFAGQHTLVPAETKNADVFFFSFDISYHTLEVCFRNTICLFDKYCPRERNRIKAFTIHSCTTPLPPSECAALILMAPSNE